MLWLSKFLQILKLFSRNVESSDSQTSQLLLSFWALGWQKDAKIEKKKKNKRRLEKCLFYSVSIYFAGINRLLGNSTYEAAFPPHEVKCVKFIVIKFLFVCLF